MRTAAPPILGWHVTFASRLCAIMRHGLLPRIGPRSRKCREQKPAVYFFTSVEEVENGLSNWLGEQLEDAGSLVVVEADISGLRSECVCGWEISVFEAVEPSRIVAAYDEDFRPLTDPHKWQRPVAHDRTGRHKVLP